MHIAILGGSTLDAESFLTNNDSFHKHGIIRYYFTEKVASGRFFHAILNNGVIFVHCKAKGYFTGSPCRGIRFERIASTAGMATHGDFRLKKPSPQSSKCLLGCLPKPLSLRNNGMPMANRTRPIILRLAVTEYEKQLIENKMKQLGTKNFGAYAQKILIDGYIIKLDYTQLSFPKEQQMGKNISNLGIR